ncbi:MAG TPA: hypothetical protein VI485_02490 [Vicinamibacterales bacterium]|nr:hypothetical protein [Vicinamibacterales bacterium]
MRPASSVIAFVLVALSGLVGADLCAAQSVSVSERDALVRLRVDRGGQASDVDALIRVADESAARGLPSAPLTNKIREGLAKGADPKRIDAVIRQMATHLETADQLVREVDATASGAGREASVTLLAESFGGGLTPGDVRELRRLAQPSGKPPLSLEGLASAAKGLSFIREARLPVTEGTAVVAEAVRQGFRAHEVLDLGREIKRRERDYQAGRATLRALRDAIARGDRPEQLFRDTRTDAVERPAATRPEAPVEQPERPGRPEAPQRPERPERAEPTRVR